MGRKKIPEDQKATKQGVGLDQECRSILSKIMEYETSIRNDLGQSQTIRKCLRLAWDLHYKALFEKYQTNLAFNEVALLNETPEGKERVGAKIETLSENLGSGSSTATTARYQKGGRRKSST
jgi:hypothetical protein